MVAEELHAAADRHLQVEKHQCDGVLGEQLAGLVPVIGLHDCVTLVFEQQPFGLGVQIPPPCASRCQQQQAGGL